MDEPTGAVVDSLVADNDDARTQITIHHPDPSGLERVTFQPQYEFFCLSEAVLGGGAWPRGMDLCTEDMAFYRGPGSGADNADNATECYCSGGDLCNGARALFDLDATVVKACEEIWKPGRTHNTACVNGARLKMDRPAPQREGKKGNGVTT